MKPSDEVSEFWSNIEKEHNAKVLFKTYAVLLGKSSDVALHISGLLYIVGPKIVFENFEKSPGIFQLMVKRQKKFEKYKTELPVAEVIDVKQVTPGTAHRCIRGAIGPSETVPVSGFQKVLFKSVCQLQLKSGQSLFLDLLDMTNFIGYFKKQDLSI